MMKLTPTNNNPMENLIVVDGLRSPSFTHNHAKIGAMDITNSGGND